MSHKLFDAWSLLWSIVRNRNEHMAYFRKQCGETIKESLIAAAPYLVVIIGMYYVPVITVLGTVFFFVRPVIIRIFDVYGEVVRTFYDDRLDSRGRGYSRRATYKGNAVHQKPIALAVNGQSHVPARPNVQDPSRQQRESSQTAQVISLPTKPYKKPPK